MNQDQTYEDPEIDFRALPAGTMLLDGQYRIDAYLSSGGFGITYRATDSLGRRVVIKECFPEALCRRTEHGVRTKTSRCINEFNALVEMFVREARSLAKLDHPNIVGVHQIFRANETAYMVLDFINGRDAMQLLETDAASFSPAHVMRLADRLLDAISAVHGADMLHRDISPDNILIDPNGTPCLIDFGAARQEATKKSRAISALMVVKDGYSPQEFYISGGQQGPASDLYSLAASLYHMITGEAPPNSQTRLAALAAKKPDPYQPLAPRVQGYDPNFLRAIDLSMNVFPKDRPQSAEDWAEIAAGQQAAEAVDDGHVRRVVSNLVNEVAMSIAKDAEAKALKAQAEAEAAALAESEPVAEKKAPEDDPWWPLTEPPEPTAQASGLPELPDQSYDRDQQEVDALPDPGLELEAAAQDGDCGSEPDNVLVLIEEVSHEEARAGLPPELDPELLVLGHEKSAEDADEQEPDLDERAGEAATAASLASRRTRRRISALVLIATLSIVFRDTLSGTEFSVTLSSFGSLFGAVMAGEAHI